MRAKIWKRRRHRQSHGKEDRRFGTHPAPFSEAVLERVVKWRRAKFGKFHTYQHQIGLQVGCVKMPEHQEVVKPQKDGLPSRYRRSVIAGRTAVASAAPLTWRRSPFRSCGNGSARVLLASARAITGCRRCARVQRSKRCRKWMRARGPPDDSNPCPPCRQYPG